LTDYFPKVCHLVGQQVVCRHCLAVGAETPKLFSLEQCLRNFLAPEQHRLVCQDVAFDSAYLAPSWNPLTEVAVLELQADGEQQRSVLGEGGFGKVFLGRLADGSDRPVAVKCFDDDVLAESSANVADLMAMQREIAITLSFDHPNL